MKFFTAVIILIVSTAFIDALPFVGGIANFIFESLPENSIKESVNSIFRKTCIIDEESIKEAWAKSDKCDNEIRVEDLTLCRYIKERLSKCFAPVLQLLEHCSIDDNKGTPTFILNTIVSSLTHFCDSKGENFLEMFNPCLRVDQFSDDCDKSVTSKMRKMWSLRDLTKSNFCDAATTLRKCVRQDLLKNCRNGATKSAVNGILDSLTVNCNF